MRAIQPQSCMSGHISVFTMAEMTFDTKMFSMAEMTYDTKMADSDVNLYTYNPL